MNISQLTLDVTPVDDIEIELDETLTLTLTADPAYLVGTPSSDTRRLWRRVCSITPLRASMSSVARSTLDAPVTMLRVYWMCPGQSAMMKLRFGVEK